MSPLQTLIAWVLGGILFLPAFLGINGVRRIQAAVGYEGVVRRPGVTELVMGIVLSGMYMSALYKLTNLKFLIGYLIATLIVAVMDDRAILLGEGRRIRVKVRDWRIQDHWRGLTLVAVIGAVIYNFWTPIIAVVYRFGSPALDFVERMTFTAFKALIEVGTWLFQAHGWPVVGMLAASWAVIVWLVCVLRNKSHQIALSLRTNTGLHDRIWELIGGYEALRFHIATKGKRASAVQEIRELIEFLQLYYIGKATQVADIERWTAYISLFRPKKGEKAS